VNPVGIHIASVAGLHLPPSVALLLTIAFVSFLFRRDIRERPNVTGALWIPLLWMLLTCSRPLTQWLSILHVPVGAASSSEEGSPLDACVYLALMAAGIYVLFKRQVTLSEVFRNNGWLVAFLLYCLISILWSDLPLVALKRWIKVLGHPIMALIVLTEPDFTEALTRLIKRGAYVIVPISILLIKYYPEVARKYDQFTGTAMNTGIAGGKNFLGADCLIVGSFFFWHLLQTWRTERSLARRHELLLIGGFLLMTLWLFREAHSATSEACIVIAILVMFLLGRRVVNKRQITIYVLVTIITLAILQLAFGISGYVIELLNRNPTLTDRTVLWANLMKVKINPIIGVGFESFWMGDRLEQAHGDFKFQPNEAHNGYLETYLNLGLIGLFILMAVLIATFFKIRRAILTDFQLGRFRFGFLAAVVLYNWTEASFRALHPIWFPFYLIAMEYPRLQWMTNEPLFEEESETELVYLHDEFGITSSVEISDGR
jgi:exopolysaccharide production protein ExoQ